MKRDDWIWFAARLFIGLVFAYAGFSKLTEPIENFRGAIAEYQVLPYSWLPFIAAVVPWMEFFSGIFMMLGYAPKITSLVLAFLCFSFLMILGASDAWLEGSKDCGCFGQGGLIHLSVRQVIALDFFNFLVSLKLFSLKNYPLSLEKWLVRKTN